MRAPLTLDELAAHGRQSAGGLALTEAQARILGAIACHAFLTPFACPSQALIAAETGYSREWVNKVIRQLWELGLLCWAKARKIGSKWDHNVYRLRHWKPAPRARLLALVDRIRGRVHTEGTTTPNLGRQPTKNNKGGTYRRKDATYSEYARLTSLLEEYGPAKFEAVYVDEHGSPRVVLLR